MSVRTARTRVATLAAALLALAGCAEDTSSPKTQIYLLVDLSATWHNDAQRDRNARVLAEVGHGIAIASGDMKQPIIVQTRVIGTNSLEREPDCEVVHSTSFAPVLSNDAEYVPDDNDFESYLARDCPATLLAKPPESHTEIENALASVAHQPALGAERRVIVILSDFLADDAKGVGDVAVNELPDLAGFDVILLYRPVQPDQADPQAMDRRIQAWRDAIVAHKGRIAESTSDTGLRRESVAQMIRGKSS